MDKKHIMVLGVGNILFKDEGVGIRVVERLKETYDFPENVEVVDGGVLGIHLLGIISHADILIVVDAVRTGGPPGTLCRLCGDQIPARVRAKNSLHQVDLLEALTLCQALDKQPETIILGIEPEDISTLSVELGPVTECKVDTLMDKVIEELAALNVTVRKKGEKSPCVSPFPASSSR